MSIIILFLHHSTAKIGSSNMAAKKTNKYNPGPRVNLISLSKKQDKLNKDIEHLRQLLNSTNRENDRHIEHLSNFVRHDMKNAIQGLDGIIYNAADDHTINDETLEQLKMAVSLLRSSLDNFAKIIPSSREQTTTLPDILVAVEMLSRYDMQQRKVTAAFDYDRNSEVPITHPFQTMVQIVDNFIINALNAFGSQADKKLHVEGVIDNDKCRIAIHDNAPHIPEADKERIFEYGYSTTGGTGIGLFHAKSVMDEIGGSIVLEDSCFDNYTKCFIIEFPIQIHNQDNE